MRLIVLVAALATVTCVDVAHGEDIPLLAEVKGKRARVTVRGEVSKAKQKELVSLVTKVVADVERRFTAASKTADPEVTLLLFSDEQRYQTIARTLRDPVISDLGFYLPGDRVAIANVGNSVGNLRHELVHPLLGDDYPDIPAWLNEGIGALYGSATATKTGFTFRVNYRLRDVQKALEADTLPTIADLAASTDADVRGEHAMVYYALARYVLLYVDGKGKLGALYAELRGATVPKHGEILARYVDDKAFRSWVKKLRY